MENFATIFKTKFKNLHDFDGTLLACVKVSKSPAKKIFSNQKKLIFKPNYCQKFIQSANYLRDFLLNISNFQNFFSFVVKKINVKKDADAVLNSTTPTSFYFL